MDALNLHSNYFSGHRYDELTWQQRNEVATALDHEYRGEVLNLDQDNLSNKISGTINLERLKKMTCPINTYTRLINVEGSNYAKKGFKRRYETANGKPPSNTIMKRIEAIYYDELDILSQMLYLERKAIYTGNIFVTIAHDFYNNNLRMIVIDTTEKTLTVETNPDNPADFISIEYKVDELNDNDDVYERWDEWYFYRYTKPRNGKTGQLLGEPVPHGYSGGVPFAMLRYVKDNRRIWGSVDTSAYKLFQARSLLIADSIVRSQTSLFDILVFSGMDWPEVKEAVREMVSGKVVKLPKISGAGEGIVNTPDLKYINPSMLEPEKIFDLWERLWYFFLQARGHSKKNFEVGADVQSAEAQWQADAYLRTLQIERQLSLAPFERKVLDLIRWKNNTIPGKVKIPDAIDMTVDFVDTQNFSSVTEQNTFYDWQLRNNLTTPIKIIMQNNPDLTEDQARAIYEENKAFNAEIKAAATNNLDNADAELRKQLAL